MLRKNRNRARFTLLHFLILFCEKKRFFGIFCDRMILAKVGFNAEITQQG
ncbi:MAG: hypothetical protein Q4D38_12420 [Planctomycetia bacterium]|nr:hypothetical protein [Planctomycetia bacterium]